MILKFTERCNLRPPLYGPIAKLNTVTGINLYLSLIIYPRYSEYNPVSYTHLDGYKRQCKHTVFSNFIVNCGMYIGLY